MPRPLLISPCRSVHAGESSTATTFSALVDKLRYVLIGQELERPLLTREGIDQLSTALSGRGLPQRSVVARALANEDAANALTEHQAVVLDAIQLLHRVEIRGGAGSGKTFLAMEQARRISAKGQRVALVCYSRRPRAVPRGPYHRAVTLAAIWSAIFTAESAGLALQVLMSMMMLFLCASARPQPQPGAPAFC